MPVVESRLVEVGNPATKKINNAQMLTSTLK